MAESRSVIWVDANGKNVITRIRTSSDATAIQAAILATSNCDYQVWWEGGENVNGSPAPVAAQYLPLQPFAELQFQCADLTIATLLLPSPKLSIFYADQATVDPSKIAALIGACTAAGGLVSQSQSPALTYLSGKLLPYRGAA